MTRFVFSRSGAYIARLAGRPSITGSALFFLLFSGPPRFRERDPLASLRGDIDAVVILHVLVSVVAGLWVFYQMRFYFQESLRPVGFRLPQKLGLGLVATLGLSTLVSVSPPLTAYMVYQMFISLMFTMIFVERYGVEACLCKLFQASALLCVAIPIVGVFLPDLVYVTTETGALRLRGDYIAGTEVVSLLCLVLLLAGVQELSKLTYGLLLGLSCALLLASLSRTAILVLFAIFLIVLLKRPASKPFRRFALIFGLSAILMFAGGLVSYMDHYRDPESVLTLSDRVGLWTYLTDVTLRESPLLGLGYYAASRIYGPQYNAVLGTAHSMFAETFAGGGLLALTVLLILCIVMTTYVLRVLCQNTKPSFTIAILFLATIMFGFIGANFDSGPVAITFWSIAASLPVVRRKEPSLRQGAVAFGNRFAEVP